MSDKNKYYNYVSFYRGIPVYVGKGLDKRLAEIYNGAVDDRVIKALLNYTVSKDD